MIELWRQVDDATASDPIQGGSVISFLASCGDERAVRALGASLETRPAAVRELVVHAFGDSELGAVRGVAASSDGIREPWQLEGAAERAAEELLAQRLEDLEPATWWIARRTSLPKGAWQRADEGLRIADAASRVLARRWHHVYANDGGSVRDAAAWEEMRLRYLGIRGKPR